MKFGVREICNVTFKAAADGQKVGTKTFKQYQPVFIIDTAQTSEMSQESTTVYAQGGRGYNRLIAWEGEKTMTFTVTDALISPMGLAVLSGADLIKAADNHSVHVHINMSAMVSKDNEAVISYTDLADEIGVTAGSIFICTDAKTPIYASVIEGSGATDISDWIDEGLKIKGQAEDETEYELKEGKDVVFVIPTGYEGKTVSLDFYVELISGASEINIEPDSFGGYFYVEADTLFRNESTGKDMAATLTFPRVKVQSAFTFTMAASGDPSTFDFTMDALPGKTRFDSTKKVCVSMSIIDGEQGVDDSKYHEAQNEHKNVVSI